ncbi:MAG: hypothetical protein VX777_09985 [Chlamydiota bacterium]|nr:hypothetical protein [Chlamydiota bacterium]
MEMVTHATAAVQDEKYKPKRRLKAKLVREALLLLTLHNRL